MFKRAFFEVRKCLYDFSNLLSSKVCETLDQNYSSLKYPCNHRVSKWKAVYFIKRRWDHKTFDHRIITKFYVLWVEKTYLHLAKIMSNKRGIFELIIRTGKIGCHEISIISFNGNLDEYTMLKNVSIKLCDTFRIYL